MQISHQFDVEHDCIYWDKVKSQSVFFRAFREILWTNNRSNAKNNGTYFLFLKSQLNIKLQDKKKIKWEAEKKHQYVVNLCFRKTLACAGCLGFAFLVSAGQRGGVGVTCLQESTTNWHRPRRKGAARHCLQDPEQPQSSVIRCRRTQTCMHCRQAWKHWHSKAGFFSYCNESLSVTVTDELIESLVQVYFYQLHKFSCSPRYGDTTVAGCLCTCEQGTPNGSAAAGCLTGSDVLRVGGNFIKQEHKQSRLRSNIYIY